MNKLHTALLLSCVSASVGAYAVEASADLGVAPLDFTPYPQPGKVVAVAVPNEANVYGLAADVGPDHAIYRSSYGGPWVRQSGWASAIGAGAPGDSNSPPYLPYIFVANSAGKSYFAPQANTPYAFIELVNDNIAVASIDFNGTQFGYDQYGPWGGVTAIYHSGSWEYMVSTAGALYVRHEPYGANNGPNDAWTAVPVPSAAKLVKVVAMGVEVWVVDVNGMIFWGGYPGDSQTLSWSQMPGCARDIAVGGSMELVVVGCGTPVIVSYNGIPAFEWNIYHYSRVTNAFVQDHFTGVAVGASKGSSSRAYAINANNDLYQTDGVYR